MKTCFVIIGFGTKPDLRSSPIREIDLDKTFKNIVQPAFKEMGFDCFRALEKNTTGSIDKVMYHWIYKADIVVADISTLNPNVMYELGVRHALKPYSTIIISESQQMKELPFDINHNVILKYEHLGKGIDFEEVMRFKEELQKVTKQILGQKLVDSPVYDFLPDLSPPSFENDEGRLLETVVTRSSGKGESLGDILEQAEKAKNGNDLKTAKMLFAQALEKVLDPKNPSYDNVVFIRQRLALVTYKSKEPDAATALAHAREILAPLDPSHSNDPETLGLSGAIDKRHFELTNDSQYCEKALGFYERGFLMSQDYYNGINAAFLYLIKSSVETDKIEAITSYGQAKKIWKQVIEICENKLTVVGFNKEEESVWVYLTLAEAYLGLEMQEKAIKNIAEAGALEVEGIPFAISSFQEQKKKLEQALASFKEQHLK